MIATVNADDRPWQDDINDPVDDQYDVILGFNEPERHDISPEDAARTWIEMQNLYPDKVFVISVAFTTRVIFQLRSL